MAPRLQSWPIARYPLPMTHSLNDAARATARLEVAIDTLEARLGELEDVVKRAASARLVNERMASERDALAEALAEAEARVRSGVAGIAPLATGALNPAQEPD
jgi:hypothetical protein